MGRRVLDSPAFYVGAAVLVVGFYLIFRFDIRLEPRPSARSVDEIATLSERDDLSVLFILVDTLRADRLSSYGYERETSPTIDRLAETGVRFAHHLSQSSWTKCSMASLWTGLYPIRTGVLRYLHALPQGARTPAEAFRDAGFRTAGIWRNGWVASNFGFSQGFETYQRPRPGRVARSVRRENPTSTLQGTDADIIRSAMEFLRLNRHERWFLYLHLMDVHQYVYDEEAALFGTTYSDLYNNSIRWVDRILGSLLRELERRNLRDKTLIVFASDHGEAFGEHGREGHARDVYSEVTETPFILSFPFRLEPGVVVRTRTENVDIWPTVLDLLGLPPLDGADGHSLVPDILATARGEALRSDEGPAFSQIDQTWGRADAQPRPIVAVTEDGYRLVHHVAAPDLTELFDRAKDPREQTNVAADQPEVVDRLRRQADRYMASPPAPWGEQPLSVELNDMELNQLRALGYAVE